MTMRFFIVAGEPSGDVIGSRLIASLKRLLPSPIEFAGVGGSYMEQEGLKSIFPMEDIAVMGVAELLPHLFTFSRRLNETVENSMEFKPHAVVTIDSKGFSFRFLKKMRERYAGSTQRRPFCVHYVAPSFWAWKNGEERLGNLSKIVDHLLCILPFEQGICNRKGVPSTFVGHPVLEDFFELGNVSNAFALWKINAGNREQFRCDIGVDLNTPLVTVLPGSRLQELRRLLPIYGDAMEQLAQMVNGISVVIPTVPSDSLTKMIESSIRGWNVPVVTLPGASLETKYQAFSASDVALCTSGTAVLQLQMSRLPTVVAYRANLLTEWMIRSRTKLQYMSLPNILQNFPVVPEALFSSCNAGNIASLLRKLLEDPTAAQAQASDAGSVMHMLQPPLTFERPSVHAARAILKAMKVY